MSTLLEQGFPITVVEFSPDALKALILKDLGLSPDTTTVEFTIRAHTTGYGMAEHDVQQFGGVRVSTTEPLVRKT